MATYSNNTPTYAYGDEGGIFTSPTSFMELGPSGLVAWCRFTGLTAVLASAAPATSATLTITGIGAPATNETIRVYGENSENAALPIDNADSAGRTRTTATTTTGNLNGVSSVDINVLSIVNELITAINGDVIQFVLDDASYSGTGLTNMLASLVIEYGGGGGGGGAVEASAAIYFAAAQAIRMGDLPSV